MSTPEVSGADVAEISYTCFAHTGTPVTVRLIVRRVRPTPGSQLTVFTTYDHHAFVTDRTGDLLEIEADHRRHAVVEQTIAELKSAGLAHLPSGRFTANAVWLALAAMAYNLGRAVGILAGHGHGQTRPPPPPSSAPCSPSRAASSPRPDACGYDFPPAGTRRHRTADHNNITDRWIRAYRSSSGAVDRHRRAPGVDGGAVSAGGVIRRHARGMGWRQLR
ncbi:transposase [Streptomyces maoxianensis]|uniref:Transposase n=1 Tax=Streptomyces maoxianensis TaxID=1459942 RepID=A0ABV9G3I6_9ACTN